MNKNGAAAETAPIPSLVWLVRWKEVARESPKLIAVAALAFHTAGTHAIVREVVAVRVPGDIETSASGGRTSRKSILSIF